MLVEGAGSASEINLRANDIANMGFARAADVPVVLIGDIDRGGVIASLFGTKAVLDPDDAALIVGFIVNKMRGDASPVRRRHGVDRERTGWAPLGLVPFFDDARAVAGRGCLGLRAWRDRQRNRAPVRIVVPVLPHIANFDDLDPLRPSRSRTGRWCARATPLPVERDLVILPGSKATIADLAALRARAGTSTSPPIGGAAGACSVCAAAIRCWAAGSPTPTASKGRRARSPVSACSTSRRC